MGPQTHSKGAEKLANDHVPLTWDETLALLAAHEDKWVTVALFGPTSRDKAPPGVGVLLGLVKSPENVVYVSWREQTNGPPRPGRIYLARATFVEADVIGEQGEHLTVLTSSDPECEQQTASSGEPDWRVEIRFAVENGEA